MLRTKEEKKVMTNSARINQTSTVSNVVRGKSKARHLLANALAGISYTLMATAFAAPVAHKVTFTQTGPTTTGAVYTGSFEVDSADLTPNASIPVSNFRTTIEGNTWIQGTDTFFVTIANTDSNSVVMSLSLGALDDVALAGTGESLNIGLFTWAVRNVAGFSINEGTYVVSVDGGANIAINIKPDSDPNSINTCSGGTTPIAIFGSETLDVTLIDPESLVFASATVKTVGKSGRMLCNIEDAGSVDGTVFDSYGLPDGYDDLVCHFLTFELTDLEDTSSTAVLTGNLLDGSALEGEDTVNIVKDCDPS